MKPNIQHIILKHLDGTITIEEKRFLTNWVKENEAHKKELEEIININQVIKPAFNPDDIDLNKAKTNLLNQINTQSQVAKYYETWKKIAAILLLPVLITSFFLFYQIRKTNQLAKNIIQEVIVPPGMRSSITLPDSTQVWLNSGTTLRFPTLFNSKDRHVTLDGEAYFKVNSDVEHPFIVKVNHMEIRSTGTEFNVESYNEDSIQAVTLMKGKIAVKLLDSINNGFINMSPNQRFVFNNINCYYNLSETKALDWQLWKDGILIFRDETLENVFKRIGRIYNANIIIKDKSLSHQKYRATFREETLDEILELIAKTSPIRYTKSTNKNNRDGINYIKTIEIYRDNSKK